MKSKILSPNRNSPSENPPLEVGKSYEVVGLSDRSNLGSITRIGERITITRKVYGESDCFVSNYVEISVPERMRTIAENLYIFKEIRLPKIHIRKGKYVSLCNIDAEIYTDNEVCVTCKSCLQLIEARNENAIA